LKGERTRHPCTLFLRSSDKGFFYNIGSEGEYFNPAGGKKCVLFSVTLFPPSGKRVAEEVSVSAAAGRRQAPRRIETPVWQVETALITGDSVSENSPLEGFETYT